MEDLGVGAVGEGGRTSTDGIGGAVPVPIGVVDDERVQFVNDAAAEFFRTDRDDLVGRDVCDLVHPDDRDEFRERLDTVLRAGDGRERAERRFRTVDGEVRHAVVTLSGVDAGTAVVVLQDVTAYKRVQQDLEAENRFVRRILDAVTDPVFVVDEDDRVVFANEFLTETTGYDESEVVERHPTTFLATEDGGSAWDRLLADDGRVELDVQTSRGERIPHEFSVDEVRDDPSGRTYRVVVGHDVSERKRRARKLRRQNERLEEFAQVVSHDLRNPLEVARTNLALLDDADPERVGEIDDALARMSDLIADVLALAQEGQVVDETETVSLGAIATQCWGTVATGDATLAVTDDVWIRADRGRLRSLLENLFSNAVEHAGDDVTVTVGPVGDDDGVGFYVADDGPGIPPEDRERVFESGYSTSDDNTGFGLVIVDQIARAHGWSITVTDDDGARFEFGGVETIDREYDD